MTSVELKNRVRTLLDESAATNGFWSDDEIYKALSDGQMEVLTQMLKRYNEKEMLLPEAFRTLVSNYQQLSITSAVNPLPNDFLFLICIRYAVASNDVNDRKPALIRGNDFNKYYHRGNGYLSSSIGQPYCTITGLNIVFEDSPVGSGSFDFDYIKKPETVDASNDPELPDFTHNAMVQYAFATLLKKDSRNTDAHQEYEVFQKMVSLLY